MHTAIGARRSNRLDFELGKFAYGLFLFFALWILADPFYTGYGAFRVTRDLGPLKYMGVFFGFFAVAVALYGRALQPGGRRKKVEPSLGVLEVWPFVILGAIVIAGSMWARTRLGIKENFLQVGVGMLCFPIAIILLQVLGDRMFAARRFLLGLLLLMPYVLAWILAKRVAGGQAFHTEIFLFVPLAVYFVLVTKSRVAAILVLLVCALAGVASHKNTAYLCTLFVLLYLVLLWAPSEISRRRPIGKAILVYVLFGSCLLAVFALAFVIIGRDEYLPSGNVAARAETYRAAFLRFLGSPGWGTLFLDSTLNDLERLTVLGKDTLVTHSDLLDILSHGGLLAMGLFVLGSAIVFRRVLRALRGVPTALERSLLHGLAAIVLCGFVTAAFNSPLLMLPIGSLFWFAFGLLFAVARVSLIRQEVDQTAIEGRLR